MTLPTPFRRTLCALVGLSAVVTQTFGDDWYSIRGPQFDGSASGDSPALASGNPGLRVRWKQSLGSGYSGVVKSGPLLVTAMADPEAGREFVVALAAASGKELWRTACGPVFKGENGSFDGPIATPAADSERVYHLTPFGRLTAYSLTDGAETWTHDLKTEYAAVSNFYGFGASPVVYGGMLIVPVGAPDGAIMAFHPESGKVIWKAGTDQVAFQSPVPVQIEGRDVILASCNTSLLAIQPDSGEVLWSVAHNGASGFPAWAAIPVPLKDGRVFLNDSREGSSSFLLAAEGASQEWSEPDIRNTYCVPVNVGGLLCSYSSRFLTAVDPQTGQRVWRSRKPGNGFLATVSDRLVVITMEGSLHIGDVTRDGFEEVAAVSVFESSGPDSDGVVWSLPAITGRSVYVRSLGAVARIDIESDGGGSDFARDDSEVSPRFAEFLKRVQAASNKAGVIDSFLLDNEFPLIDGDIVHFVFRGDHQDVAVASELLGARQERSMLRVPDTDLFYYGIRQSRPARTSYLFYADFQPTSDPLNDRRVRSSLLTGEMELAFLGPAPMLEMSWFDTRPDSKESADTVGTRLAGTLLKRELDSKALKQSLNYSVYLPPGYAAARDRDYPVVFVHDGAVALDSGHQAGVLDRLIQDGEVRPSIAVFIDRRFYPMAGANGYVEMFIGELIPAVDDEFRTAAGRADRASLSGGFGATLALMSSLPASGQIGAIGCHSPFAFEMLHPALKSLSGSAPQKCRIRIQWGINDLRNPSENWDMADQGRAIAKLLSESGHQVETSTSQTGTDWVSWRTQSSDMWKFLVGH